MSNGLTGDYDIVLQVAIGAVNRVLATMHQRGVVAAVSPKFLHSVLARIGSRPGDLPFEQAEILLGEYLGAQADLANVPQDVLASVQEHVIEAQAATNKLGLDLARLVADPAEGGLLTNALASVAAVSVVRGMAQIQLGTPTLTLLAGATAEVTVHTHVRALYSPDAGTSALPEPIHGEVRATFLAKYNLSGAAGTPAIDVKPTSDDSKITFIPAAGTLLTAVEAKAIARQIRLFLRRKFGPMSAPVPANFVFRQFKGLVSGGISAIALPLKLAGHVPAFALDTVNNMFLAPNDAFGIAIGKDFIDEMIEPSLQGLKQFSKGYKLEDLLGGVTAAFHIWVTNVTLQWKAGVITVVVTGAAKQWGYLVPDHDYAFTAKQDLTLHLDGQAVVLQKSGDVMIAGNLPQLYVDFALPKIRSARDDAVANSQGAVQALTGALNVGDALKPFDAAASAEYTAIQTTADGVILRGSATMSWRPDPIVDFVETPDGEALTAFRSWIPAGTIDRFIWSWVTNSSVLPWGGTPHEVPALHRFVFEWNSKPQQGPEQAPNPPPPPWKVHQMCLAVEGTQIGSKSGVADVSGGSTCQVRQPEWLAVIPAWLADLLLVPVWGPDPGPEAILDSTIVAHINIRPDSAPAEARTSTIIHFADGAAPPLPALSEALRRSRHVDSQIPVVVVLPNGALAQRRAVVEQSLGSFAANVEVPLVVTEDYEGSWTRAFGGTATATTHLLSAQGELVWTHQGRLDATALASTLDQHATVGPRRLARLLRLSVQVGDFAPELAGDRAPRHARLLRQGRALLLFCKSWSTPCLRELMRLQRLQDEGGLPELAILAIADGEDASRIEEIIRRYNLRIPLLPDPDRQISRRYGINCWPTMISIRQDGLIDRIHYGRTHVIPTRAPVAPPIQPDALRSGGPDHERQLASRVRASHASDDIQRVLDSMPPAESSAT